VQYNKTTQKYIDGRLNSANGRELKLIEQATEELPAVPLAEVYGLYKGQWVKFGYRCLECDKQFNHPIVVEKHKNVCSRINTLTKQKMQLKEEKHMPIQVVTQNGERYYRYGDSGKLYKDRKDAEKQAAAIRASGYREPKKSMEKK
jgi:DNA-directed RNA polymerase subunit RPC12/RpoP